MDKEQIAIERLKTASDMSFSVYGEPLIVCHSGGKDSAVITELAKRTAIPFEVVNSHTTVDAPETVRFIRSEFQKFEEEGIKCKILFPKYKGKRTSMWALIPIKLMPPMPQMRYCCDVLKENNEETKNRMIVTGVRWAESRKRKANRGIYETLSTQSKEKIKLTNDNDDKRQLFENCKLKAKRVVNPIVDWEDSDVWNFIYSEKLSVNPLYQCGWSRIGCIGCPLARKYREFEFRQYPRYKTLYIKAFEKMIIERNKKGKCLTWKTGEEVFDVWMDRPEAFGQTNLFSNIEGEEE